MRPAEPEPDRRSGADVRDQAGAGAPAVRRLPADALAGLRTAYAGELAERLPRLRAAAAAARPDAGLLAAACRDAHALASSSVVVGEVVAAAAARAVEAALLRHAVDGDPRDLAAVRSGVGALVTALDGWTP